MENIDKMSRVQKLTFSAMVMAIYIVVLYFKQSVSLGAYQIRIATWNRVLIAVPIVLVPGLGVATYLSYFLNMPYQLMALNLCIGQLLPSVVGVVLVKALERVWRPARVSTSR